MRADITAFIVSQHYWLSIAGMGAALSLSLFIVLFMH